MNQVSLWKALSYLITCTQNYTKEHKLSYLSLFLFELCILHATDILSLQINEIQRFCFLLKIHILKFSLALHFFCENTAFDVR